MLFTVLEYLENSAQLRSHKTAIVESGIETTFAELKIKAKSAAKVLFDIGVRSGDRVGICMNKSTDQIVYILGTMYANAIFVPILPGLKQPSIKHIVTDSGMHLIITDEKRKTEVENFKENVRVLNLGIDKSSDFRNTQEVLNKNGNNEPIEYKRIGTDLAAIIYSSGSTGRPKGIMVTNRNFWDGAQIVSHYLNTNERDRIAAILSFNFDYGLNQIWQSLFTGASLHLHELVMPNDCIKFIYTEGITALPLMPVIISKLFDIKMFNRNHGYDLSKVRYVCSSGGRISLDMLKNIKSEFQKANFYSMYGLTEAFRSTYLSPEQIEQRPNSIGMAIPDVEILILDEDGLECKVGSIGELVHRGGCIARGYWNDPEKTAERFRTHPKYPGEILVYSGDLVTKDVDGYITFVARKDGMLKNNGIRISPTEIEEVFEMHDDVSAAIVFGIDNINNGHDIVCVYTAKNKTPIPEYELKKYLKNNLGSHMVPRYILFQTIFPTTGNQGKIDKVTVKENALHILRKEPDFYND